MRVFTSFPAAMAASLLILPASAAAQRANHPLAPPTATAAAAPNESERHVVPADMSVERSDGMLRVLPLADNVELGIGRYSVHEIARPRTHLEAERNPADIRLRDRRIAGMGVRLSF